MKRTLVLALVAVVLATGCGKSEQSEPTSAPTTSMTTTTPTTTTRPPATTSTAPPTTVPPPPTTSSYDRMAERVWAGVWSDMPESRRQDICVVARADLDLAVSAIAGSPEANGQAAYDASVRVISANLARECGL
jgi:hypothetical protein